MHEAAYDDFSTYSKVFSKEDLITAELMRITLEKFENDQLLASLDCPTVKELYDITCEISYSADRSYKKEKGIDDSVFFLDPYLKKDDVFDEMRTLLREEVQNYFGERNEPGK